MAGEIELLPERLLAGVVGFDANGLAGQASPDWQRFFNVRRYGAVGDGIAHLLSDKFATLSAAQAVYPKASALTETIDWHAHQAAIDAALAAGGGTVYTPKGVYIMQGPSALKFPMCQDSQFFPQASDDTDGSDRAMVNWKGDGHHLSILKWTADSGTLGSDYAVMCGSQVGDPVNQQVNSRYGPFRMSAGYFDDIAIVGPSHTLLPANTPGAVGANMSGICWASRRRLNRVRVTGFYAGVDIVGDHTKFDDCFIAYNYYNFYFNHNSPTMYGDLNFTGKTQIGYARKACFGFHWGGKMGATQFDGRVFAGTSPYVFFKEASPGVIPDGYTAQSAFIGGCLFNGIFFEGIGNAVFWDENFDVNGVAVGVLDACMFNGMTHSSFVDTYKITGKPRTFMKLGQINGGGMFNVTYLAVSGATLPIFDLDSGILGDFTLEGDLETWLDACATVGQMPVRVAIANDACLSRFKLHHSKSSSNSLGPWRGCFYPSYSTSAVNKGNAVSTVFNGVKQAAASDTDGAFVGVARMAAMPNNPAVGGTLSVVAVAEEGDNVPVTTLAPFTAQKLKKTSATSGALTDANRAGDGLVVGFGDGGTTVRLRRRTSTDPISVLRPILAVTGSYTPFASDCGKTITMTSASALTLTLDGTRNAGYEIEIIQTGAGAITWTAGSGATVTVKSGMTKSNGQGSSFKARVVSNTTGSNAAWIVTGDLAA